MPLPPGELLACGDTHIFRVQENQRLGSKPSLRRSRHPGDRGAGHSVVSPFPADRQASESQAESSWQKQKSISSLPGPGEQSLQVSLAQGHPTAAGREWDLPGTAQGGWGGAGACAGSKGLAHLGFWSGLGSGAPFLPPAMRPGETHPALLGGLGERKTQTQRGFLLRPLEQLSSSHRTLAPGRPGTRAWARTLTPRFVYLDSCISCLAKPHGRLNPGRHKPTQSPWQSPQQPIRHPIPAAALSSPTHIIPFDEALPLAQIGLHLGGQQDGVQKRHVARRPSWRGWAGRVPGRRGGRRAGRRGA